MFPVLVITTCIKISFFILTDNYFVGFAFQAQGCFYGFFFGKFNISLMSAKKFFSLVKYCRRRKQAQGFQIDRFHFRDRMPLVILYVISIQHIFVDHFLKLKKRSGLMPAYISKVVRTSAPYRK